MSGHVHTCIEISPNFSAGSVVGFMNYRSEIALTRSNSLHPGHRPPAAQAKFPDNQGEIAEGKYVPHAPRMPSIPAGQPLRTSGYAVSLFVGSCVSRRRCGLSKGRSGRSV